MPSTPSVPPPHVDAAGATDPSVAPAGRSFGPYRIDRLIGRGAIGSVHLAFDPQGHALALKLVPLRAQGAAADADDTRERFLAEARTAARLSHPDIVRLLAAGELDGTGWLAMELVPGCGLDRYTRPARLLPEALALDVAQRLARALGHAHDCGIVHRDVKPANVVIDLPGGSLKLTDFGLARWADAARTRTGVVVGTPWYMAPEQLAGGAPEPRSDLYALAVLIFQLLTGRLPHDAASMGDLLRRVALEPAPDLRTLRPDLPNSLASAMARALQKHPSQRQRDMASFADELQQAARDWAGRAASGSEQ